MKLVLLLTLFCPMLQSQPLSDKDFQSGPLAVGKSIKDLLPQLGDLKKLSTEAVPQTGGIANIDGRDTLVAPDSCYIYEFDSLTIQTNGFGYIDHFTFTRRGFKTNRGIRVGDSIRKVMRQYGKESLDDSEIEYLQERAAMSIVFRFFKGKVSAISMGSYTP